MREYVGRSCVKLVVLVRECGVVFIDYDSRIVVIVFSTDALTWLNQHKEQNYVKNVSVGNIDHPSTHSLCESRRMDNRSS